jgi:hypothetical protein
LGGAGPPRQPELGLTAPSMAGNFEAGDFDRALAHVGAETSPQALVEQLGLDWEYLTWLALDASNAVLGEHAETPGGAVVSFGGEAFTAGFLIGVHLHKCPAPEPARLTAAMDLVQERGGHAVIADHCDLESVARVENIYAEALVESLAMVDADSDELRSPLRRICEAGLAVGLQVGSGGDRDRAVE